MKNNAVNQKLNQNSLDHEYHDITRYQQEINAIHAYLNDPTSQIFASETDEAAYLIQIASYFQQIQHQSNATNVLFNGLEKHPNNVALYAKLAEILLDAGMPHEAQEALSQSISRQNNKVDYWILAARIAWAQGQMQIAHECIAKAFELQPQSLSAKRLLAELYVELEHDDEAYQICDDLRSRQDDADAQLCQAKIQFKQGKIKEACLNFDARFSSIEGAVDIYPELKDILRWDGSKLTSKKILITSEFAFKDSLLFATLIPKLHLGNPKAEILIEADEAHDQLYTQSFPFATIIPTTYIATDKKFVHIYSQHNDIDFWCPMGSLGQHLLSAPKPKQPCFTVTDDDCAPWLEILKPYANKIKVGIDLSPYPYMPMRPEQWKDLLKLEGCKFISINPRVEPELLDKWHIHPCPFNTLNSRGEIAGCLNNFDLVISPLNEASILAAGLGKNVLQLTAQNDWRHLGSKKSAWFNDNVTLIWHSYKEDYAKQISDMVKKCKKKLT